MNNLIDSSTARASQSPLKLNPRRFDISTSPRGYVVLLALALTTMSCAPRSGPPSGEFLTQWRRYSKMNSHRAIAVAGEIFRTKWVVGMAGGAQSDDDAVIAALDECRRQRSLMRIKETCRIYAIGVELRDSKKS